jgi:DNA polymerase-3 subunit alpha
MIDEVGKRGNRIILKIDDRTGRIEATLFEEAYLQYKSILVKGAIVVLEGKIRYDDFIDGWRLNINKAQAVEQIRQQNARCLLLRWPEVNGVRRDVARQLEQILKPHRNGSGACSIAVHYRNQSARAVVNFSDDWKIAPNNELLEQLRKLCGSDGVQLSYGRG